MTVPHNIYIHVPFCASKCNYCAFYSAAVRPNWEKYACDICVEIAHWGKLLNHPDVPTIFFGGGTPSLMPVSIFAKIIDTIHKNFHIIPNAEITIEANPGTVTPGALNEFIACGVNRISVGVQSLDDNKLQFLGRRHSANDARILLDTATNRNIRVNGDFIYGLPGDTTESVAKMCRDINDLGLTHCSMYELTIEPSTPFGKMKLDMPSESEMADMYIAIGEKLNTPRYEVSNYATPGHECKHNANIWDGDAYIGIGRAAAGRVFMDGEWYEQMGAGAIFSKMTADARAVEKVITGMRTCRGVKITADVNSVINWQWAQSNPELVQRIGDRLRATDLGVLTLDRILIELIR